MEPEDSVEPIAAVAALIDGYRPDGRRLRELLCLLAESPADLAELVRRSALPRRTVEELLGAADGDLVREGGTVAIAAGKAAEYRKRFDFEQLGATRLADPLQRRVSEASAVRDVMEQVIAGAPAARSELDHVQATPETAIRRALWLDSTYDLRDAVLLCVGDHDLTSLAVGQVAAGARIVVADIDERTLEYIDEWATRLHLDIRCFVSDFRFWLADSAASCADLVFTDPPYTPEGMTLFTARALQGLANRDHGRIVVAYGYSDRHPSLGQQGQSVIHRLGLAAEEQLRAFSRYEGAQAVGSASDLYVWRPTSRSWRLLDGVLSDIQTNIYSQGGQSLEGSPHDGNSGWNAVPAAVLRVTADAGFPLRVVTADAWTGQASPGVGQAAAPARVRLSTLFSTGIPAGMMSQTPFAVAADLRADPGAWLLRVLLAANADRVVAVVPSRHQDVRDEAGQRALAALVGAKYTLRFLTGQPEAGNTIVQATAVAGNELSPGASAAPWMLRRAHGKVGNIWREALLAAAQETQETTGHTLTKREARAIVEARARRTDLLSARLIDLPRHQIAGLLEDVAASS
ncbi:MAG: bis-aminopropyl spermidine synthase family protein [Trebonia sp.]